MILSHRHRFLYFCNCRTGTTSIERALAHLQEDEGYAYRAPGLFLAKHIPPAMLRARVPAAVWGYFKFVFVRNPFDWFVSLWHHNFRHREVPQDGRVSGVPWMEVTPDGRLLYLGRPAAELAARTRYSVEDVDLLFEFLHRYHRILPSAAAPLQSSYVFAPGGERLVDFVGRYERLSEDFASALQGRGLAVDLPRLNRTAHRDYRSYFTPESAQRVARLWADDFAAFGYEPALTSIGAGGSPRS